MNTQRAHRETLERRLRDTTLHVWRAATSEPHGSHHDLYPGAWIPRPTPIPMMRAVLEAADPGPAVEVLPPALEAVLDELVEPFEHTSAARRRNNLASLRYARADERGLFTVEQVAESFRISRGTVFRLVSAGELRPSARRGRRLLFDIFELERYLTRPA